jgi:hypothetical protein
MALLKTIQLNRSKMTTDPLSFFNQLLRSLEVPEEKWNETKEVEFNFEPDSVKVK